MDLRKFTKDGRAIIKANLNADLETLIELGLSDKDIEAYKSINDDIEAEIVEVDEAQEIEEVEEIQEENLDFIITEEEIKPVININKVSTTIESDACMVLNLETNRYIRMSVNAAKRLNSNQYKIVSYV